MWVMLQQVRAREVEVESRHIATDDRHILDEWSAVARAGGTALVAAMATNGWQATRSGIAGLFNYRGPAIQAAIELQLDAHAALVSRTGNPDEVREVLAAVWRLELTALLRHHPEAKDPVRTLVVQVWEALPTPHQTWMRTNIAHNQAAQYTAEPSCGQTRDDHRVAGVA
ncbi:MAG TPA: hypothetical protein VE645_16165 [Pseudonocardiaceae bacterium]|jgi:hypothetical protein|nr:hypothetical protein [Pseudonocardiaceae bacterium]